LGLKSSLKVLFKLEIKTILVSQPKPESEKSPYYSLAEKHKIKVDFRSFIHVEGVESQEFRKDRVAIENYNSVIFTSRNAVDHYFRLSSEMRVPIRDSVKYFCVSEAIAYYLQKYVVYRKRKVFFGKQTFGDMLGILLKHKEDKFLLPCSDILKKEIPSLLEENGLAYTKSIFYRTVCSDLSDLANVNYDMLVFFSPSGIKSLFQNFPEFCQNDTRIAAFGPTTAKAVETAGLTLDLKAPMPNAPSMTMAIEYYLKKVNGKK
jgi:uroporphyrinogen-III synthase